MNTVTHNGIAGPLEAECFKGPLRFMACGGVGEGKSTLIARLLGAPGAGRGELAAAETPGDAQHLHRFLAEARRAHAIVIVVDVRKGMPLQARQDGYLASLLGIPHVLLAVNKLDAVQYSQDMFARIHDEYLAFAEKIGLREVVCIPLSALQGDNVMAPGANMPWYRGPTLLGYLERLAPQDDIRDRPFRFLVDEASASDLERRSFSGRIVGGAIKTRDRVRALPGGKDTVVERIATDRGELAVAVTSQSATVTLADAVDLHPGDMLAAADAPAEVADQFEADVIWMSEEPMLAGRPYLLRIGAKTVGATITKPKYKVNVNTLEHLAATTLELNEIGVCNLHLDQPVPFDPYKDNRDTGGFILIDRLTNAAIGAGLLHFALRRSQNIHWQAVEVNKQAHAALKDQRPCVVWFTGLSGAGKSTIANLVEKKLHALGRHTYLLDGDNVRHGLNKDLGFTEADRVENIRRVAEVARLMVDAGLIVLVSFISPFRAERQFARARVEPGEFCEVFVDTPLGVAEQRDKKGLYKKARRGELKNFTGIDSPYEAPESAEVHIDTTQSRAEEAADRIIAHLRSAGILEPA